MSVKASELGKCYRKSEDGFYRLYKVDGLWTIYSVHAGEAVFGGHLSNPENFDHGVYELECEARSLMAEAKAEFGF